MKTRRERRRPSGQRSDERRMDEMLDAVDRDRRLASPTLRMPLTRSTSVAVAVEQQRQPDAEHRVQSTGPSKIDG